MEEVNRYEPAQPEVPPQQPIATVTPEVFEKIKVALISHVEKAYAVFLQSIMSIPCEQKGLQNAMLFLDSGYVWLEKAIKNLPALPQNMGIVTPEQQASPETPPAS